MHKNCLCAVSVTSNYRAYLRQEWCVPSVRVKCDISYSVYTCPPTETFFTRRDNVPEIRCCCGRRPPSHRSGRERRCSLRVVSYCASLALQYSMAIESCSQSPKLAGAILYENVIVWLRERVPKQKDWGLAKARTVELRGAFDGQCDKPAHATRNKYHNLRLCVPHFHPHYIRFSSCVQSWRSQFVKQAFESTRGGKGQATTGARVDSAGNV